MIAIIGLMIAGYIVLRCLELLAIRGDHWSGRLAAAAMRIWAVLTLALTVCLAYQLVSTGLESGGKLPLP